MRRASNRLWILILALGLIAGGLASMPTPSRADYFPGEQAPPPGPEGTGDPDMPVVTVLMSRAATETAAPAAEAGAEGAAPAAAPAAE